MKGSPTLGQILREAIRGGWAPDLRLAPDQWKVLRALAACRTLALGGQLFYCPGCGHQHLVAHSCRNRHCPQCQGKLALDWLEQQEQALLPIPYFHLVFTLPHALNGLVRQNRRGLYKLLFEAASGTLLEFGRQRLGAQIGITAVLHTWSQNLLDHYHVHCIVSGGGLAIEGSGWVKSPNYYLFPVQALSGMFRGKFLAGLKALYGAGGLSFHGQLEGLSGSHDFGRWVRQLRKTGWVVYAKRPFAGPWQVLKYLSNYTHRVAICNGRLLGADAQGVSFSYKDYAEGQQRKTMRLEVGEFVRRFCLHVLPQGFVKIRHYGLLSNRHRRQRLERARELLAVAPATEVQGQPEPAGQECSAAAWAGPGRCPCCGRLTLILVREVRPMPVCQALPIWDSS